MANLTQTEIDALQLGACAGAGEELKEDIFEFFSADEIDALGEIGNICIGTSATTMSALVGRRVIITTPRVDVYKAENALSTYKCPFLAINVEYTSGIRGENLLLVKDYDAAIITDLMMGGEGEVDADDIELDEIHLSAMSEVMNQMIGSAATAMSNMMGDEVSISTPQVVKVDADESVAKFFGGASSIVKISFDMEIEGLLKSKLLQIMTVNVAKELIGLLMNPADNERIPSRAPSIGNPAAASTRHPPDLERRTAQPSEKQQVKVVKPASFQSFDEKMKNGSGQNAGKSNFDLINDIPLQVAVELGKAVKNLSEVLDFGTGSIIVLDKQAGDLVDVIVNGKYIAKGEVVVIDENYGVRITEILKA